VNSKIHIFLDIDDVLTTSYQQNALRKNWHEEYSRYHFDKKCVMVLNEIIKKTNPHIILTSDWKYGFTIERMNEIFKLNRVNGVISDYTRSLWGIRFKTFQELDECRATEILKYVEEYQVENYIAIDDLDLSPWIDDKHFVRTLRANEGIKQTEVKDKILNILLN